MRDGLVNNSMQSKALTYRGHPPAVAKFRPHTVAIVYMLCDLGPHMSELPRRKFADYGGDEMSRNNSPH